MTVTARPPSATGIIEGARLRRGEKNGHAKMTARDVRLARDLAALGYEVAGIARWLGGGYDSVRDAVSGRSWPADRTA